MTVAGIACGGYRLAGRESVNPLADTAQNCVKTTPLIIIIGIITILINQDIQLSQKGIMLAVLSGAIASGIGYTIWYMALAGLTATQAAVVQLLVPVIAATGGVIFVDEIITSRLLFSSVMILGGILLVVSGRYYFLQRKTT
jgi:drug/metabolite transporter (DMT)-like permease